MIVCYRVCLGVALMSSLCSCDKSQSSLGDETPREEIYDSWVPFRGSVFRQVRGVERKPLPAFAVFQVPIAQNNQYAKVTYFEVTYSAILHCHFRPCRQSMDLRFNVRAAGSMKGASLRRDLIGLTPSKDLSSYCQSLKFFPLSLTAIHNGGTTMEFLKPNRK